MLTPTLFFRLPQAVPLCDSIHDMCLGPLAALRNLQHLDVAWAAVTNDSTVDFINVCPSLRVLSLQGCKGLRVGVVDALLAGAAPKLKFIDFGWVNMFSSTMAESLTVHRPGVTVIGTSPSSPLCQDTLSHLSLTLCPCSDYYMQVYVGGRVVDERL